MDDKFASDLPTWPLRHGSMAVAIGLPHSPPQSRCPLYIYISLGFSEKPKFGFSTSVPLKPIGDCLIVETKFWFLTFS